MPLELLCRLRSNGHREPTPTPGSRTKAASPKTHGCRPTNGKHQGKRHPATLAVEPGSRSGA